MKAQNFILLLCCCVCLIVLILTLAVSTGQVINQMRAGDKALNDRLDAIEKALDSVKEQGSYYGVDIDWKDEEK